MSQTNCSALSQTENAKTEQEERAKVGSRFSLFRRLLFTILFSPQILAGIHSDFMICVLASWMKRI